MNIYTVVVIDRHTDPEVTSFYKKENAENYARTYANIMAKENGWTTEDYEHNTLDGLIRTIEYSCEDDCVYIYERSMADTIDGKLVTN